MTGTTGGEHRVVRRRRLGTESVGIGVGVLVLVCGAVPAGARSAWPQAGGPYARVLGKDDEAFARNLSRYGYADLAELERRYRPDRLGEGWNVVDGEEIYFTAHPGAGLWGTRERFEG